MKRVLFLAAALLLPLLALPAQAATPSCSGGGGSVSVDLIANGNAILEGTASLVCPKGTAGVLTASAQHYENGAWVDKPSWTDGTTNGAYSGQRLTWTATAHSVGRTSSSWKAFLTLQFACIPGQWRINGPTPGPVAVFTNRDGEGCGNWGGGL